MLPSILVVPKPSFSSARCTKSSVFAQQLKTTLFTGFSGPDKLGKERTNARKMAHLFTTEELPSLD